MRRSLLTILAAAILLPTACTEGMPSQPPPQKPKEVPKSPEKPDPKPPEQRPPKEETKKGPERDPEGDLKAPDTFKVKFVTSKGDVVITVTRAWALPAYEAGSSRVASARRVRRARMDGASSRMRRLTRLLVLFHRGEFGYFPSRPSGK